LPLALKKMLLMLPVLPAKPLMIGLIITLVSLPNLTNGDMNNRKYRHAGCSKQFQLQSTQFLPKLLKET
jgi:hypothetical protein